MMTEEIYVNKVQLKKMSTASSSQNQSFQNKTAAQKNLHQDCYNDNSNGQTQQNLALQVPSV